MKIAIIRHKLEHAELALFEFDCKIRNLLSSVGGYVVVDCKARKEYCLPAIGRLTVHALSYNQSTRGLRFDAVYSSHDADPFYLPPPETVKP